MQRVNNSSSNPMHPVDSIMQMWLQRPLFTNAPLYADGVAATMILPCYILCNHCPVIGCTCR